MKEHLTFWCKLHGRAGREGDMGNVIVQTYNPESFTIECAKEQNYIKLF